AALPQATDRLPHARTRFQSSWRCHLTPVITRCLTLTLTGAQTVPIMATGPLQRVVRLHWLHRRLLSRSAIRVCQPGPVALHRSMTSTGSRIEMSLRGFAERGRPPLFTTARDKACALSSG